MIGSPAAGRPRNCRTAEADPRPADASPEALCTPASGRQEARPTRRATLCPAQSAGHKPGRCGSHWKAASEPVRTRARPARRRRRHLRTRRCALPARRRRRRIGPDTKPGRAGPCGSPDASVRTRARPGLRCRRPAAGPTQLPGHHDVGADKSLIGPGRRWPRPVQGRRAGMDRDGAGRTGPGRAGTGRDGKALPGLAVRTARLPPTPPRLLPARS